MIQERDKKMISAMMIVLLILLIFASPPDIEARNSKMLSKGSAMQFESGEIYDFVKIAAKNWSDDAQLVLAWALEYPQEGFVFPDWYYIPSPEEINYTIKGDSNIGDGNATIWEFIFFSPHNKELLEIRTYLTLSGSWRIDEYVASTPFDYSSFGIEFKPLPKVENRENAVAYLLWKYRDKYTWKIFSAEMQNDEISLNEVMKGKTPCFVYFWESSIPFILRGSEMYPFEPGNRGIGIIVLPDYGKYGDFHATTYLIGYPDKLRVLYSGKMLDAKIAIKNCSMLKAKSFDLQRMEENLSKKDFWKSSGDDFTNRIITYYLFNNKQKDMLVISIRTGSDVSGGIAGIIDVEDFEENSISIFYTFLRIIPVILLLLVIWIWRKRINIK